MSVRVRIAPSPTGDPHVGTAYMALFNYVFARHHGGQFVLRIEDTDQSRSHSQYEDNIYEALRWCGLDWDEGPDVGGSFGPYRQSERTDLYRQAAEELIQKGMAYKCFATQEELAEMRELASVRGGRQGYDRRYRNLTEDEVQERVVAGQSYVIRLKIPLKGDCVYEDAIKGRVSVPWADVDDQVLLKSDGFPTYHLANVVDDHAMQITHVIRGDEWMSSTPKHIMLYDAFGWDAPTFMHMPLLLGTDGKKLSKRKNPTSIFYYRDSGYLVEAFMNFMSLMGYSMPEDKEVYSLQELVSTFDPKRIGVSGAVFDVAKLDWLNQQYIINHIPENQLWSRMREWIYSDRFMEKLMPLCHTRIKTFGEFMELCDFFFVGQLNYDEEMFRPKGIDKELAASILQAMLWCLEERQDWSKDSFFTASKEVAEAFSVNHKKVVMPLLFAAVMGKRFGPPFFDSAALLGKDRTRARFLASIDFLGGIGKKKRARLESMWKERACQEAL